MESYICGKTIFLKQGNNKHKIRKIKSPEKEKPDRILILPHSNKNQVMEGKVAIVWWYLAQNERTKYQWKELRVQKPIHAHTGADVRQMQYLRSVGKIDY